MVNAMILYARDAAEKPKKQPRAGGQGVRNDLLQNPSGQLSIGWHGAPADTTDLADKSKKEKEKAGKGKEEPKALTMSDLEKVLANHSKSVQGEVSKLLRAAEFSPPRPRGRPRKDTPGSEDDDAGSGAQTSK